MTGIIRRFLRTICKALKSGRRSERATSVRPAGPALESNVLPPRNDEIGVKPRSPMEASDPENGGSPDDIVAIEEKASSGLPWRQLMRDLDEIGQATRKIEIMEDRFENTRRLLNTAADRRKGSWRRDSGKNGIESLEWRRLAARVFRVLVVRLKTIERDLELERRHLDIAYGRIHNMVGISSAGQE
ncbi:MAG: hypothetical protein M1837_005113 [Sclerophora amabilis]|nr:MAG: hypothetical protein M1837_005113 [Sclerophora amabilis]